MCTAHNSTHSSTKELTASKEVTTLIFTGVLGYSPWCEDIGVLIAPYAFTARPLLIPLVLSKTSEQQHILSSHINTFSQSVCMCVGATQWTYADQYQAACAL